MATWTALQEACKKLKFGQNLVANAKKIKADTHLEFLTELFTKELEDRDIKRRNSYINTAGFDVVKTFEKYTFEDIKFPKDLSPDDLKNAAFIPKNENIVMYGTVGAGKTHLAIAIGMAACNLGYKTKFWRTATLVNALTEAKAEGTLSRFMKQFDKVDLLICDEWGYVPFDSDGTKLLFQVVSDCYERRSMIITTNLEFTRWNDIFTDPKITAALLDRVIHHSHLLDYTERESWRLKEALMSIS